MPSEAALTADLPYPTRTLGSPAHALRYGLCGLCALSLGAMAQGYAWLLVWLAVALQLVAYAYAFNHVAIFGKRSDGSMQPLRVLVFLPYLLLLWAAHWLMRAGRRRELCWHLVAPGIYIGRRPRRDELPEDCRIVVDMTSEFCEAPAVTVACVYRALPTLNRHVPEERAFGRLLGELADFEGAIYLHCGAGRGRSAMTAAALLVIRRLAPDVDAAEQRLRAVRPGVKLHPAQRAFIMRLCAHVRPVAAAQSQAAPA